MVEASLDGIADAMLSLDTRRECVAFLRAFLSTTELAQLTNRWDIFEALTENADISQRRLAAAHCVALTTAARGKAAFIGSETFLREIIVRARRKREEQQVKCGRN